MLDRISKDGIEDKQQIQQRNDELVKKNVTLENEIRKYKQKIEELEIMMSHNKDSVFEQ